MSPYSDVLMLLGDFLIVGWIKSPFRFRFYHSMLLSARGFRSSLSSWQNFCRSSRSLLRNAHRMSVSAFLISGLLIWGPCIRNHNNCTRSRWSVAVPLDQNAAKRTVNERQKQQQQAVLIIPGGEEAVCVMSLVKSFLRREAACCKLSSGPAVWRRMLSCLL